MYLLHRILPSRNLAFLWSGGSFFTRRRIRACSLCFFGSLVCSRGIQSLWICLLFLFHRIMSCCNFSWIGLCDMISRHYLSWICFAFGSYFLLAFPYQRLRICCTLGSGFLCFWLVNRKPHDLFFPSFLEAVFFAPALLAVVFLLMTITDQNIQSHFMMLYKQ